MAFLGDKERRVIEYMLSRKKDKQFTFNDIVDNLKEYHVDCKDALSILEWLESVDFLYLFECHAGMYVYKINYEFFEDMRKLLSVVSFYDYNINSMCYILKHPELIERSYDEHRKH